MTNPGLVRMAHLTALVNPGDLTTFKPMFMLGLSSYELPHALPLLMPAFVLGVKNNLLSKKQRLLSAIMLACSLMLVYFSGATGPMLVSLMVLLMSFLVSKGSTASNVLKLSVVVLIMAPFIIDDQFMLAGLDWVDGLLGGEGYFHSKVEDFQDTIMYGGAEGDVEERQDLYGNSISVLLENPLHILIGAQEGYGVHSVLLDRLASLGLIGFIPLISLFVVQFKFVMKHISSQYYVYYFLGLFAAFMMMISKNVSGWNLWFILFSALPFCVFVYSDSDQTNMGKFRSCRNC